MATAATAQWKWAAGWQGGGGGSGGSAAAVTKTPAATAMVGAQTTINNQLKVATATATEIAMMTATMIMMRTKATVLPPRAATVATKTPAATAIVGAQTTINNQLKAETATATATATMTATMMTMKMKAMAVAAAAAAWQQCGRGSNGSAATARGRRPALRAKEPPRQMTTSCRDWTCNPKCQQKRKDGGEGTTWSKPVSMSLNYGSGWTDAT